MPNAPEPRAGEIWDMDVSPQIGREQAGVRPARVVSTDNFNELDNDLVIVAPITSTDRDLAYHVRIAPPEGGRSRPSAIMCDQETSQSIRRFLRRRGSVSEETLRTVQRIVGALIDR